MVVTYVCPRQDSLGCLTAVERIAEIAAEAQAGVPSFGAMMVELLWVQGALKQYSQLSENCQVKKRTILFF